MKNIQNIVKGFLVLAFITGVAIATPVKADNNDGPKGLLSTQVSAKANALMKLESSVGVVMGKEGLVQVMGAKVVSVSGNDISATILFGNSSLNFTLKTNSTSKLNGKLLTDASVLNQLKAGDSISFTGMITSSTNSSIVVTGSHIVSQALYNKSKIEDKNSFKGEIKAINTADNSFTLKLKSGVTVKVLVLGSTVISVDDIIKTLSSLQVENKVKVTGTSNADGSVITASKVSAESENDNDDNDKDEVKSPKENKGWFGKMRNWFWK